MGLKELPKDPVEVTLKMLGNKWKVIIVRELLNGTKRFNELKKSVSGITQKVLSAKLKELEGDGIIIRKVCDDKLQKVEYTLTDVGYSLNTVILSLKDWGKDYKKYLKLLDKMKK